MRFEKIFQTFEEGMLSLMKASFSIRQAVEHCLHGNPEVSPTTVVVALAKNIFWSDTQYQARKPNLIVDGQVYESGHDPDDDLPYDRHSNIVFPPAPLPVKREVTYMTSGGIEFGWSGDATCSGNNFEFFIEWSPKKKPSTLEKSLTDAGWTRVEDLTCDQGANCVRAARFHS